MEGKAGLRLLSVFLEFFGPSAQFARHKLRVGGEIHVGAHSISAEYHLVSMIRHRVRLKTTKTLRVIRVTRVLVTLTQVRTK